MIVLHDLAGQASKLLICNLVYSEAHKFKHLIKRGVCFYFPESHALRLELHKVENLQKLQD